MIHTRILARSPDLSQQFQSAKPFKHFCVDGFFNDEVAEQLLADFPSFDASKAINEFGKMGNKSVNVGLKDISAFYSGVYEYLLS
ncbi:MAG: hypothetical protein WA777_21295 [Rhodanobacter sp.]